MYARSLTFWDIKQRDKTQHLMIKKHGICENQVRKTVKSREINALGFKEKSFYSQTTSSKNYDRYDDTQDDTPWA